MSLPSPKNYRSSRPKVFCKKGFLRNFARFTGKHLCQSLSFNKVADRPGNFIKRKTLAQMFSRKSREISKSTFFTEHLRRLLLKLVLYLALVLSLLKYRSTYVHLPFFKISAITKCMLEVPTFFWKKGFINESDFIISGQSLKR